MRKLLAFVVVGLMAFTFGYRLGQAPVGQTGHIRWSGELSITPPHVVESGGFMPVGFVTNGLGKPVVIEGILVDGNSIGIDQITSLNGAKIELPIDLHTVYLFPGDSAFFSVENDYFDDIRILYYVIDELFVPYLQEIMVSNQGG